MHRLKEQERRRWVALIWTEIEEQPPAVTSEQSVAETKDVRKYTLSVDQSIQIFKSGERVGSTWLRLIFRTSMVIFFLLLHFFWNLVAVILQMDTDFCQDLMNILEKKNSMLQTARSVHMVRNFAFLPRPSVSSTFQPFRCMAECIGVELERLFWLGQSVKCQMFKSSASFSTVCPWRPPKIISLQHVSVHMGARYDIVVLAQMAAAFGLSECVTTTECERETRRNSRSHIQNVFRLMAWQSC